jgi:phosphoribosyl 1,2-cyclic phosphate phosphodiesterase
MSLTFTILGCGSSMGVPRPALGWGACDPDNPKNRRRRTSLLVERRGPKGRTRVLVDTSPDLRQQLLDAEIDWLDGADDPRACRSLTASTIAPLFVRIAAADMYLNETTVALRARFAIALKPPGEYPPIVNEHRLVPGEAVTMTGGGPIRALPILQHGDIVRWAPAACYSCDLSAGRERGGACRARGLGGRRAALQSAPEPLQRAGRAGLDRAP